MFASSPLLTIILSANVTPVFAYDLAACTDIYNSLISMILYKSIKFLRKFVNFLFLFFDFCYKNVVVEEIGAGGS